MKSGGPWNLRGLRPEAREAARSAARQSGMSVGEWLNSVIRPGDPEYGEQMRFADDYAEYNNNDGWRDDNRWEPRQELHQEQPREYRQEPRREFRQEPRRDYRHDYR